MSPALNFLSASCLKATSTTLQPFAFVSRSTAAIAKLPEQQQNAASSSRHAQNKRCKQAHASICCSSVLAMLLVDILHSSHSFLCWPCQIFIVLFASAPSSQMLHLLLPSLKMLHLFEGFGCLPVSVFSPIPVQSALPGESSWLSQGLDSSAVFQHIVALSLTLHCRRFHSGLGRAA